MEHLERFIGGLFKSREGAERARNALYEEDLDEGSIHLLQCTHDEKAVILKKSFDPIHWRRRANRRIDPRRNWGRGRTAGWIGRHPYPKSGTLSYHPAIHSNFYPGRYAAPELASYWVQSPARPEHTTIRLTPFNSPERVICCWPFKTRTLHGEPTLRRTRRKMALSVSKSLVIRGILRSGRL